MKVRRWGACGLAAAAIAISAAPALAAEGDLNAYRVEATPQNLRALAEAGYDVTEGRNSKRGTVDVVATANQISQLKVDARKVVDAAGRSAADRSRLKIPGTNAAAQDDATAGASDTNYTVWRKYDAFDEPDDEDHPENEHEQYTEFYDRMLDEHPDLVAERVLGQTYGGRDIIALQVTKDPTGADVAGKPAVLYNAMQHAREWLAGETCKRTLSYYVDNYGKTTSAGLEVTQIVDNNELWFVCVNNPDGYEYTFTDGNRLWRKNLRDNDNNGAIALGDGVDPNRNFSANWGRDDEGSSKDPTTETYRGPGPASEPETQAMEDLFAEIHPVFQKNDHTAAELLLYPQGFQQDTPTADHEIFTALAGDPFKPAIEGFLPELGAGLYITNGDFTDWAYSTQGTLSYTPEGTEAEDPDVTGFEYPDSEKQVQQEFRRHLPFALDLAKSADDPTEPDSHLGNKAEDFTIDSFKYSYGDPQQVQATVKRKLGDVTMKFSINNGPTLQVPTKEFTGGERYYKNDAVYYHRVRGFVSGTKPGDKVKVWFTAGGKTSPDFTYDAVSETTNPVLLLSDEDWSGVQPAPPQSGPAYLDAYKALLDSLGIKYDVYDVSKDRTAPHNLGVLSHYSHVVWYTGDDYVPREPDAPGGSGITRLAVDTQNRVRDFLNEGGKLFYTGQNAGRVYAEGYEYNPFQVEEGTYCQNENPSCIAVQDDFLQYWLGANTYVGNAGTAEDDSPLTISGFADPFDDRTYTLANPDVADPDGDDPENPHTAALLVTSSVYDPVAYPQWADSKKVLAWDRPGASPFEPFTGDWFMSAGTDDAAYKRFQHEADLTGATSATFSFRTSYDLEADYDYMFVEIHTAGEDDWTTLAENNDETSDDTGLSCPATAEDASNWQADHPFLAHYQTKSGDGATCTPSGSSGEWNAATGNSGGWKAWELDIPAEYLGKEVEISITVANDPASQGLGIWVDDARLATNSGDVFNTSFEDGDGGFTRPGPPEGTENPAVGWERAQSAPFAEGAGVSTNDTVYTGFGLEKLDSAADQSALLADVFEHLGAPSKPSFDAPAPTPEPSGGGTPAPGPGPVATQPLPTAGQRGLSMFRIGGQQLEVARRLGVRFTVRCPTTCPLVVEMRVDRATQRKLKLKSRRVGRLRTTITSSTRSKRVKFNKAAKKALRNRKRVRVILIAVVPGAQEGGRFIASARLR